MSQNYSYPSSSVVTIASVGPNGLPIPTSSDLIGGKDGSGNLIPLSVDGSGNLNVNVLSISPISGTVKAQLQDNNGVPIVVGQALMATSLPVVIASNQSTLAVSAASLPLPTGAATAANQVLEITDLDALNARLAGSLVPKAFDEVDITYVGITTDINTVTYKLAASTVATLTMSYDGSGRLSSVVKT